MPIVPLPPSRIASFAVTLMVLSLAACGGSENEAAPEGDWDGGAGDATYLCEGSPVQWYYEPDTMGYVSYASPSQGCTGLLFFIIPVSGDMTYETEVTYRYSTEGYKQHTEYYGDTTYSKRISIGDGYCVSAMPLNSISITADKDFDAEHPAGSLLNDYFVLEYSSAYDVIKSGYDPALDITDDRWHSEYDAYQLMPLSEFEPINLLHYNVSLHFTKLPDVLGEYTFTIAFEYGTDPVSGKEAKKIAPAVVKAVFTEADYVNVPVHEPLNKGE